MSAFGYAPVEHATRSMQVLTDGPSVFEPNHFARCMHHYGILASPRDEAMLVTQLDACGVVSESDWAVLCALISVEPMYERILREGLGLRKDGNNWNIVLGAITARQLVNCKRHPTVDIACV